MSIGPEHRYATDFHDRFIDKYQAGRKEHGTVLTSRDCLAEAEGEVLDLWAYVQAMKDQREEAIGWLEDINEELIRDCVMGSRDPKYNTISAVINILKFGNKEGRPEGIPVTEEEV